MANGLKAKLQALLGDGWTSGLADREKVNWEALVGYFQKTMGSRKEMAPILSQIAAFAAVPEGGFTVVFYLLGHGAIKASTRAG